MNERAEDYQVVITAITSAYLALTQLDQASITSLIKDDLARKLEAVKTEAFRVLHDRIFIAEELKKARIMNEWLYVLDLYNSPGMSESGVAFSALTAELAEMAISDASA